MDKYNNEQVPTEQELRSLAMGIVHGEVDLIEGCRQFLRTWYASGRPNSELIEPLIALESETDELPLGEAQELYSRDYVERVDAEVSAYVKQVKPLIIAAFNRILKTLSLPAKEDK